MQSWLNYYCNIYEAGDMWDATRTAAVDCWCLGSIYLHSILVLLQGLWLENQRVLDTINSQQVVTTNFIPVLWYGFKLKLSTTLINLANSSLQHRFCLSNWKSTVVLCQWGLLAHPRSFWCASEIHSSEQDTLVGYDQQTSLSL